MVEYRCPVSDGNGFVAADNHRLIVDNKRTITLDKYSGMLTVREKGRFTKEKKRFLTPEQLHEIIIFVHKGSGRHLINSSIFHSINAYSKY